MNKVLIVCGPTATGKTNLALRLAQTLDGELVSADSRQAYKGLDALTGKDRSEKIPIWLYDVVDIGEDFSVAHFVMLAQRAIADIQKRGKLPIVVGGTGFYLRALTESIDTISIPPNSALRKKLHSKPLEKLQEQLRNVDSPRWLTMNDSDRKNPRRLIRAIEVAKSGKNSSYEVPMYDVLWVGLTMPLPALKERIEKKVSARFERALGEVRDDLPPILGTGPLSSFLQGKSSKEEALKEWARLEYQYAGRQLVWFQKQKHILWLDEAEVEARVRQWYT